LLLTHIYTLSKLYYCK